MNSCILLADIVQDPQLRYTADNLAIAEMIVQIEGIRENDPPSTLKVVGWGNLAQEIQDQYHVGDRVLIEGRLNINTVDRPEGFKEKQAELTAQRLHRVGASDPAIAADYSASVSASASLATPSEAPKAPSSSKSVRQEPPKPAYAAPREEEPNFDDIPF